MLKIVEPAKEFLESQADLRKIVMDMLKSGPTDARMFKMDAISHSSQRYTVNGIPLLLKGWCYLSPYP